MFQKRKFLILLILHFVTVNCEDLDSIQRDFGEWRMEIVPEYATSVNIPKYNDRLESFNYTDFEKLKSKVDEYLQRLKTSVQYDSLSSNKKVDYDIFKDTLQAVVDGYPWRLYNPLNPVNFLEGPQSDPSTFVESTPFYTEGDFVNYLARLSLYPKQIEEMIGRFEEAVKTKHTYHLVSIEEVPGQIQRILTNNSKEFIFYRPFNETLENISSIPEDMKVEFRMNGEKLVGLVVGALRKLKHYIEDSYMSHLRSGPGVSSWDNGGDFYKACLKWHLSLPLTPEEVHQRGLSEVQRIYGKMQKIMDRLNFKGTVKQFFESLKTNKKCNCYNKTKSEVMKEFDNIINHRIESKLSQLFENRPILPLKVQEMTTDGPGGSYSAGPPDGSRPGTFYLNLFRPAKMPTYDFMSLALHETNPGHHLQTSYSSAAKLPSFRKFMEDSKYFQAPFLFPFYTAYVEGWALYAESLGEEMNLYKDDYELMGRYGSEIFRACRLVVDTGLHHYNWTRDKAIEYMLNYTAYNRDDITNEIDRYITWPGQACAYKIGELKIRELRENASKELGSKFDVKEYHSVILKNGAMPLTTMEKVVNNWIAEVKTKSNCKADNSMDNNDGNDIYDKSSAEMLQDLEDDFGKWRMEIAPEFATSVNIPKYNDRLESYNYTDFETLKSKVDWYLHRLKTSVQYNSLSSTGKVDYDIFQDSLQTIVDGYPWRLYNALNPVNFLEGPQSQTDFFTDMTPFNTQGDFQNYIARLKLVPNQIKEMIGRFREAVTQGHTYHNVSISDVPDQIDRILTDNPVEFIFYKPFNETLDNATSITQEIKEKLKTDAVGLVKAIVDAYREMKRYIQNKYMTHLRPKTSVSSWDNGTEFYKACLKWHLSLPLTPEEVHNKGLSEVKRIYGEMQKIMDKLKFRGTVKQFFESLKSDKNCNCYNKSKDEVMQAFNNIIFHRIEGKLPQLFKDRPTLPVIVQEMPTDGPGGQYLSGPPDGSRPGIFQVNLFRPREMPTYDFMSLALHETIPGHHLQISTAQTANLPNFRKYMDSSKYFQVPYQFPFYTAYVEGWALYAESLGEEMNLYRDAYEMMGRFGSEIFRACRLVVDTGLHYFNWDRERAIEYMLNYTAYNRDEITNEINRYITWPGQACAYKIGELKIRELRNKAKEQLGTNFDVRDFHSVVLKAGAMSLVTLEKVVDNWIKSAPGPSKQLTSDEILTELQDDFGKWKLERAPEFSTSVNIHTYDDILESYNYTEFETIKNKVDWYLNKLSCSVEYNLLSETGKVDYDIFRDTLQTIVDGYPWRLYNALNPVSFLEGPSSETDVVVDTSPFNTQGDFLNYLTRLKLVPQQMEEMIGRCVEAIRQKHTYHNVSIFAVPNQIDHVLTDNPAEFLFYQPFNQTLESATSVPQDMKKQFQKEAINATVSILATSRKLKDFIQHEYMKNLRSSPSISSWDHGEEFYKAALKWHLGLPISPEDIHNTGLDEVKRIYGKIQKIMEKLKFRGTLRQFYESLKTDKNCNCYNKSKNQVMEEFNNIIFDRIEGKLSQLFNDIPTLPFKVQEMRNDGPMAKYIPAQPDGSRPGIFFVNLFRPRETPIYDLMALSLQQTIPGRHLQISTAQMANLPSFRKYMDHSKYYQIPFQFPFYPAFAEGWALYAESLGEEMNLYKDDYEMMGRYSSEIFRASRLVVDTGIHFHKWDRERAIEYMLNYTSFSRNKIANEIDRYITWPGQACAYKIGELKIRELRNKARKQLGSNFDVKEFHSVVLKNGAMPLATLEKIINNWITDVKFAPPKSTKTTCPKQYVNKGSPNGKNVNAIILFLLFCLIMF